MKPLLSYYGGKQRLSKLILSLMPSDFKCYVEPFCGGASVFFALEPDKKRIEVLNDKDDRIVTFYRVAKSRGDELVKMIDCTPYSRSCHKRASLIWKDVSGVDELEIAWAVYVTIMQGFSRVPARGWGISLSQKYSPPQHFNRTKLDMAEKVARLSSVYVEGEDALSVIERWDSSDTFFYIDPPYPETDCGHYRKNQYTLSDYQKLIDCLSSIKGRFILSNYEQSVKLPDSWTIFEQSHSSSAARGRSVKSLDRTELLILNYQNSDSFFDYDKL